MRIERLPRPRTAFLTCIFILGALAVGRLGADEAFRGFRVAETGHFEIVFEPRDETWAAELASFAEDVYGEVTGYFGSSPDKIRVLLVNRVDAPNGYFTPFPPHIAIYLCGPSGALSGPADGDWIRLVFTHELTHYVHVMHRDGLAVKMSAVFGPTFGAFNAAPLPGWAIEGITTNLETAFSSGGRGRSRFFEMYYKAALVEQEYWRLGEASASGPEIVPDGRMYAAGYVFIAYLRSRFGSDVFARVEKLRHSDFLTFDEAVKRTTGEPIETLYDELRMELSRRYRDDLAVPDGTRISPRTTAAHYYPPAWAGDGKFVLFRRRPDALNAVVVYDPGTGDERVLFEASIWPFGLSATADGSVLVFASYEADGALPAPMTVRCDIWRWSRSTGRTERLTRSGGFTQAAVSPDGSRIVAVRSEGPCSSLVEIGQGGETVTLFPLPGRAGSAPGAARLTVSEPAFSPDGKNIAFVVGTRAGMELALMDCGDGSVARYAVPAPPVASLFGVDTGDPAVAAASVFLPRFDADGSILFGCDRTGSVAVYRWKPGDAGAAAEIADPVGAYCAVSTPGGLVYGSLSYRGFVLKRPSAVKPSGSVEVVPVVPADIARPEPTAIASRPFLNAPGPSLFLPYPTWVASPDGMEWGGGVFGVFSSLPLGNGMPDTLVAASVAWYPGIRQADAFASLMTTIGPLDLSAGAMRGLAYSADGAFAVREAAIAFFGLPVVNRARYPHSRLLEAGLGGALIRTTEAPADFVLSGPDSGGESSTLGFFFASVLFDWQKAGIPFLEAPAGLVTAAFTVAAAPTAGGFHGVSSLLKTRGREALGVIRFQADVLAAWRAGGPEIFSPGVLGFGEAALGTSSPPVVSAVGGVSLLLPFGGSSLEYRVETMVGYDGQWRIAPDFYVDAGMLMEMGIADLRMGAAIRMDPAMARDLTPDDMVWYFTYETPLGF
ncbi:MAG: hypothetical protein NT080_05220 [Spirochaetes bacterium]|nr:hypothetical protein [Spirochaetota bacterium]